jgi:hypothetical protein
MKGDDVAFLRALHCLTAAIYYEAGSEALEGQRAVAQVILNRVRHPAFPNSVCAVTYEGSTRRTGCQFTFTCDGALRRQPAQDAWARARAVALAALKGDVFAPVGYATHYHANYVVPYWATSLSKNALFGRHIFYRWQGYWGQPSAFVRQHSGQERDWRLLRHAALGLRAAPSDEQELQIATDPRVELIGIIHILALGERQKQLSRYEREVYEFFGGYREHVAVQIYRQLQAKKAGLDLQTAVSLLMSVSEPPKLKRESVSPRELVRRAGGAKTLDGFIDALRDFVTHTDFQKFYEKQRPFYTQLQEETRGPAQAVLARVELNTQDHVPPIRFVVTPALRHFSFGGCGPATIKGSRRWVVVAAANASAKPNENTSGVVDSVINIAREEC